ncbi:HMA2 domain-containing protein, partial [Clostridium perfringens]
DEYRVYEKFLHQALQKLDGIEKLEVNNVTGSILVIYDINKVYEKKILKWVDKVKAIGIKNYDLIEKYGETNLDYVVKTIEQQLDEALKEI